MGTTLIGSCSKQQRQYLVRLQQLGAAWMELPQAPRHGAAAQLPAHLSPQFHCCPVHLCRAPVIPRHAARDEARSGAGIAYTSHSALARSKCCQPPAATHWRWYCGHIQQPIRTYPFSRGGPTQPAPLCTPAKYLCIPHYRHTRLAAWPDPGNSRWQTGVRSRGHQGKGRGGSGRLIPGRGLRSSQPGTCTMGYTACRGPQARRLRPRHNYIQVFQPLWRIKGQKHPYGSPMPLTLQAAVLTEANFPGLHQCKSGRSKACVSQEACNGESLSEALGSCNMLSATWAGTTGRRKAVGRDEGVPTPILLRDHQCCSGSQGPDTLPHGFTPTWAPAPQGNSCCANPAVRRERGQGQGAHTVPLAVVPRRVVPAAQALPSEGAAVVSVAIAVAGLAAGKAPEAGQAAVALPPIHPREAVALACLCVAEGVVRASGMALARCKKRVRGAVFLQQTLNAGSRSQRSPELRA